MDCPLCGTRLMRGKVGTKTQLDSTDVEYVEQWCCTKKDCANYAGSDLDNPTKVAHRASQITPSVTF